MFKLLGGFIVGVFVGAMVYEIVNRKKPELIEGVRENARRRVRAASEAFDAFDDRVAARQGVS